MRGSLLAIANVLLLAGAAHAQVAVTAPRASADSTTVQPAPARAHAVAPATQRAPAAAQPRAAAPGVNATAQRPDNAGGGLCYNPGIPGTADVNIPGIPGTPAVGDMPAMPGTPGLVIPGTPGTPGFWYPCR